MKSSQMKLAVMAFCIGAAASSQASTLSVSVLPTATTHLVTVPAHRAAVVRNVIVSNPGTSAVCAQQILKGAAVKLDVCVPAGSSFEAHFSPALYYTAGETVDFKNSDAVTATNVTVNFRIIPPGKGLIQNEE